MMPGNLFRLQVLSTFGDRRRIILRIGVSFLLAIPFIFVEMPVRAKTAGIVMVILFTSFFGAAVGHARLRADMRFSRLMLLPTSRGVIWLDLVLASTLSRLVPALIVLSGFVIINGQNVMPASIISLVGLLYSSLVLLTLLGMGTGRLARSNGEVHLFGALVCAMIALISGVTPVPERVIWLKVATAWNPIGRMLTLLTSMGNGSTHFSNAELIIMLLLLGAIIFAVIFRWISGGMSKMEKLDSRDVKDNN
jgi:ABC-type multidrug transport system permease subunit